MKPETILRRKFLSFKQMWHLQTEAGKVVEMESLLALHRDYEIPVPPQLLILLACYKAGQFEVVPTVEPAKLQKRKASRTNTRRKPSPMPLFENEPAMK